MVVEVRFHRATVSAVGFLTSHKASVSPRVRRTCCRDHGKSAET